MVEHATRGRQQVATSVLSSVSSQGEPIHNVASAVLSAIWVSGGQVMVEHATRGRHVIPPVVVAPGVESEAHVIVPVCAT